MTVTRFSPVRTGFTTPAGGTRAEEGVPQTPVSSPASTVRPEGLKVGSVDSFESRGAAVSRAGSGGPPMDVFETSSIHKLLRGPSERSEGGKNGGGGSTSGGPVTDGLNRDSRPA